MIETAQFVALLRILAFQFDLQAQFIDRIGIAQGLLITNLVGLLQIKQRLIENTTAAVERGVFGAPTFFVDYEMLFGQDSLDFVEEALLGRSYLTPSET